ncbi:MAG: ABC transporter ATP-binding protein [Gemmatimonadota bacterium]|nr:ABC transporter ATP-binding protein [Gemmatimonadota bacterium]
MTDQPGTVADGAVPGIDPPATPGPPLISARRLRKDYGGETVLDVDELDLLPGELLAVLGPNGSGKSTLLRLLAMLEKPTAGEVAFAGESGSRAENRIRAASSAVFQKPHFWRESVRFNVGLGLKLRGIERLEIDARVNEICEGLGITPVLDSPITSLSGGQAQRVALARALVVDPEVLFLDEPTANLDSEARIDLRTDLENIVRRRTTSVLLITHDRNEAFHLADRIAVLRRGRLVQVGSPADLYEDPADPYVARMTGAELTIRGIVTAADGRKLTVDAGGVSLVAVGRVAVGTSVKVAYRPEDLVLAPAHDSREESSVRNVLRSTIHERRDMGGLVRLRLAGPPELLALVTRDAADELALDPGTRVTVRVKATALHAYPASDPANPATPSRSDTPTPTTTREREPE